MILCSGTGYISTNIILKDINGMSSCMFQLASFRCKNKENKRIYDKWLCIINGDYGKYIKENFIKGQKIYFNGKLEQRTTVIKDTENAEKKEYRTYNFLRIDHIEFMANPKNESYKDVEVSENIEKEEDEEIDTENEIFS